MKPIKTIQTLKFRLELRNTLRKQSWDLLKITYDEVKKELERRIGNESH